MKIKFWFSFSMIQLFLLLVSIQIFFLSCDSRLQTVDIPTRNLMKSDAIQSIEVSQGNSPKMKNIISNGRFVSGQIEYLGTEFDGSNILITNDTLG